MRALILLLLLAGCADYPIHESAETRTITWRRTPDAVALCDSFSPPARNEFTVACAFWSGSHCTVLTVPGEYNDQVGHEMRHCFDGAWHP